MRVLSPLGAGLLLQLIACIGCSLPAISRDKENSSTVDGLEATQGKDAGSTGVSSGKVDSSDVESASSSDERSTANVVKDDGGLRVLASDAGTNEPPVHTVESRSDAGIGAADSASDSPRTDAHLLVDAGGNIIVEAASDAGEFDAEVIDGQVTEAGLECAATDGRCDPTGACSKDTCQFDTSGKSCAFTPTRPVPFTCVIAGDALDFSPCDLDDACKPGSVCVADTFIGRDTNDNPVPRRSGSMCRPACHTNEDCAEGDWCQQATDDSNQPIPDLRVCHRYCQEPAQCYAEPVSADIRCTPRDTLLGLEQSECSRKPNNLLPPKPADTNPTDSTAAKAAAVTGEVTTDLASHGLILLQAAPLLQAVRGSDEADSPSYCLSNWDCEAADALCVENVCRVGCEQSNDCSVGAECLVVDGTSVCSDPCPIDTGAGNSCSINPNCGCSEGETCRVNDDQTMTCSGIGEHGYMDWCSTQDHCGDGLSCIAGLCRPMCVPGVSECIPGQGECVLTIKSEAVDTYTCSGDCDPVDPNSSAGGRIRCGTGAVCLPTWDPQMFPHALCVSENPEHGPRAKGGDCADDVDCASGLGCDAAGTCRHWCRTEADCGSGEHCDVLASIYGAVERLGLDGEDVLGVCQAL